MSVFKLPGTAIQANTITTTQLQTTVVTQISAGGGPKVKSLIYPGNDTAANTVGGQTVYITGSGFAANAQVLVNGSAVPSQSFISASNISFTTPALSTGTYPVYVINPEDGGTAILYPGLLISGEPTWVSSASLNSSQDELSAWSYSLSATGDTPITYALAAGNTLPTGISLAANGLISGTISSPTGNVTTYTFSVIATDAQNQDSTRQFTVTTATGEGVVFANNVLLIHADGTNNGNNHQFLDSSNNNLTITRFGNATQGSFSPFSQTGWSAYFDGTGDYLSVPYATTNFDWWTSDYTIEAWVFPTNLSNWQNANDPSMVGNLDPSSGTNYWSFGPMSNRTVRFKYWNGSSNNIDSTELITLNAWNHIAFTKTSSGGRVWVNGIGTTAVAVSGTPLSSSGNNLVIGQYDSKCINGYVSNLRIIKGTALYTSNFTPSTTPLTAVSNTKLLTLQSNRFIDNSTNALTITRSGDVSIQAFSPFAPIDAYSTASVGGSAYFDGTGDYLTVADNAGLDVGLSNNPFTIEFWVWFNNLSSSQTTYARGGGTGGWDGTSGWQWSNFYYSADGNFYNQFWNGSGRTDFAFNFNSAGGKTMQWNHVAYVYNGSNYSCFLNGNRAATTTATFGKPSNSNKTCIGAATGVVSGETNVLNGYISGLKIIKGTAAYDPTLTTLTVPTSPPTNTANTSLLSNFTNAQIFDQTAKNVLETVGDAKISTAQYKYGTGSMYFDGTGDYLIAPSKICDFGTGNFTVEGWIRVSNTTGAKFIADSRNTGSDAGFGLLLEDSTGYKLRVYRNGGYLITSSSTISSNTWYHVAFVRNNSNSFLYIDGTQVANSSDTNSYTQAGSFRIGAGWNNGDFFNGYIDDLRITRGYARYTSNFTPPTSALKDK